MPTLHWNSWPSLVISKSREYLNHPFGNGAKPGKPKAQDASIGVRESQFMPAKVLHSKTPTYSPHWQYHCAPKSTRILHVNILQLNAGVLCQCPVRPRPCLNWPFMFSLTSSSQAAPVTFNPRSSTAFPFGQNPLNLNREFLFRHGFVHYRTWV